MVQHFNLNSDQDSFILNDVILVIAKNLHQAPLRSVYETSFLYT